MKKLFIGLFDGFAMIKCKKRRCRFNATSNSSFEKTLKKFTSTFMDGTTVSCTYTFDADGKIAKIELANRSYLFNFISTSSLVVMEVNNLTKSLTATIHCTLNYKGFISSMYFKSTNGDVKSSIMFTYDKDGYLVKQQQKQVTGNCIEDVYDFEDGSLIRSQHFTNGLLNNTILYTYNQQKPDKTPFGPGSFWFVKNLFGKQSNFLPTEIKRVQPNGQVIQYSQLTYEFDKAGYPLKRIVHNLLTGTTIINTFVFT